MYVYVYVCVVLYKPGMVGCVSSWGGDGGKEAECSPGISPTTMVEIAPGMSNTAAMPIKGAYTCTYTHTRTHTHIHIHTYTQTTGGQSWCEVDAAKAQIYVNRTHFNRDWFTYPYTLHTHTHTHIHTYTHTRIRT